MSGQGTPDEQNRDPSQTDRVNLTVPQHTLMNLEEQLPHLTGDQERIRYCIQRELERQDQQE